jgi:hypothetical protein
MPYQLRRKKIDVQITKTDTHLGCPMSGLDIFAIIVLVILLLAAVAIWVVLAMLPGKIAKSRNHPQAEAINIGGWLGALFAGVAWPIFLIWAYTKPIRITQKEETSSDLETLNKRIDTLEAKLATGRGKRA